MKELEKLLTAAKQSHLTKADIVRLSGLSRPTIDNFFKGADMKMSSLEAIRKALIDGGEGQLLTEVTGDNNAEAECCGAKPTIKGSNPDDKTTLSIKCEMQALLLTQKDTIISLLNQRIADLEAQLNALNRRPSPAKPHTISPSTRVSADA